MDVVTAWGSRRERPDLAGRQPALYNTARLTNRMADILRPSPESIESEEAAARCFVIHGYHLSIEDVGWGSAIRDERYEGASVLTMNPVSSHHIMLTYRSSRTSSVRFFRFTCMKPTWGACQPEPSSTRDQNSRKGCNVLTADLLNRLLEFDTPTVANGIELLGQRDPTVGYTGPDVRALMPELGRRIGIAVTARLDTTTAGVDDPGTLYEDWLHSIARAARGENGERLPVFAVMESVGPRPRYTVTIGDGMGTTIVLAGAVGFLTNGSIRDIAGVRQVPLACWGAGLSPMHGRLRWIDINSPVVIDGMTVRPGDVIQADENGALVIPPAIVEETYVKALAVRETEARLFARLKEPGQTLERFLGR